MKGNYSMVSLIILTVGVILFIIYVSERMKGRSAKSLILKTLTSCCFLAISFCGLLEAFWTPVLDGPSPELTAKLVTFPLLIFAGQFFGLLGDIWLGIRSDSSQDKKRLMIAGFASFGLGHILFIEALIASFWQGDGLWWLLVPVLLTVLYGIVTIPLGQKLGIEFGSFHGASVIYGMILFFAAVFAGSLLIKGGFYGCRLWVFFAGIVLFAASDAVLARVYFGKEKGKKTLVLANLILYYAAQFLIAMSTGM